MTREEIKLAIQSFLGSDGLSYLKEYSDQDKFYIAWGSMHGGCVGMQVRNYLTYKYPDILDSVGTYQDFEDLTCELAKELLNENV